jgi:hypothetical protein
MDDVRLELAELRAIVERQQQRIAELGGQPPRTVESDPGNAPTTRRGLLAGAAAAVAGGAMLTSGGRAEAANTDPLVLGSATNTASSATSLRLTEVIGGGTAGIGVADITLNSFPYTAALAGHTKGNLSAGVFGYDNSASPGGQYGVLGASINGYAVTGLATGQFATGVYGQGPRRGVEGRTVGATVNSIGVLAGGPASSTALLANGVFRAKRAGLAGVPAGTRVKTVTLSPLTSTALVFAMVQKVAGNIAVQAVTVKTTAPTSFTIRLNANAPTGGMPVAWFVVDAIGSALS